MKNQISFVALNNTLHVLDHMIQHRLEASTLVATVNGCVIVWENGFNSDHKVRLACLNSGDVVIAMTKKSDQNWKKYWWVSNFASTVLPPLTLKLDLDESLEHIRHFIWANHDI